MGFISQREMIDTIKNICENRNMKTIDISSMEIINIIKLWDKLENRNDVLTFFDCSKGNNNVSRLLFQSIDCEKYAMKSIFNKLNDYNEYIFISVKGQMSSLSIKTTSILYINKFIDESLSNEPIEYICNICEKNYTEDDDINELATCAVCFQSFCFDCLKKNYLINKMTHCPFCCSPDLIKVGIAK